MKEKSSTLGRRIKIAVVCVVILLPVSLVIWRWRLSARVDAELQRLRDAGLPAGPAEINAWRRLPAASENGALRIMEGFTLMRPFPGSATNSRTYLDALHTNHWSPEFTAMIEAHVETNQAAFAKIREGLAAPDFDYVRDYSPGMNTLLPHLAKLKDAANLFSARAEFELLKGDERAFVEDTTSIVKLAETLDREPILISWLVRATIAKVAAERVEWGLGYAKISEPGRKTLDAAFASAVSTNYLPRALAGERAMAIPVFRLKTRELSQGYLDEQFEFNTRTVSIAALAAVGLFELDSLYYMNEMGKGIRLTERPLLERVADTNFVDVSAEGPRRGAILTATVFPSVRKAIERDAVMRATVDSVRTALAIEGFRERNGVAPQKMEELVPRFLSGVPVDPFDGKAMRYRKLDAGYLLYSVDVDGKDDAGVERDPDNRRNQRGATYDLVFKVE
jgi:hypothetical protein